MRQLAWLWLIALGCGYGVARGAATGPQTAHASTSMTASSQSGPWLVVPIGLIGPASEEILTSAFARAHAQGNAGLVLQVDTPGGSLETTRAMVKQLLASDLPVVAWVGPAGSRAGSAGAFITLAANIAAMAPGTNIGASHPVEATGRNVGADAGAPGSELERKVTNDTVAFMESIAAERHRNAQMARSFVATSVAITAEEAVEHQVVDLEAQSLDELFAKIDGRKVELQPGRTVTLATRGAARVVLEPTLRQRLLDLIANPNIFYLLFMAGLVGLGYELTHPGIVFPGVVGGVCLLLALISISVLPVNYGALALILAGIGMMVGEAFLPAYGSLGIGGVVALVLGSLFLVDPTDAEGLRISLYVIAPIGGLAAAAFLALGYLVLRARRAPVRSGREALPGASAVALEDFRAGSGPVRVAGAIWTARLAPGTADVRVQRGDRMVVEAARGLELEVSKQP